MTVSIVPRPAGWLPATRRADGKPFWIVPASTGNGVYYATSSGCTCPSARHRGGVCKRQKRVVELEQRLTSKLEMSETRPSYADVFPECRTDGCHDVADHPSGWCDRCASDREWEARCESQRTRVVESWL